MHQETDCSKSSESLRRTTLSLLIFKHLLAFFLRDLNFCQLPNEGYRLYNSEDDKKIENL